MKLFNYLKNVGEINFYLQPIYSTNDRKIIAYELLTRLNIKDSLLSPPMFFENTPVHEQYVLTLEIFKNLDSILCALDNNIKLHVNIAMNDLNRKDVRDYILFYKDDIIIEIIENSSDMYNFTEVLLDLSRQGVIFALDDFGSMYGSYNYITDLCENYNIFKIIKIDGNIIKGIDKNIHKQKFIKFLIAFLHKNNQTVVLEYVENKSIEDICISLKADALQGHYFAKPFDIKLLNSKKKAS